VSGLIYGLIRNKKRKLFKLLSLPDSSEGVKMKSKLACGLIVLVLFSMSVFASVDSAPPAIPSEYWGTVTLDGAPAGDGLAVTAEVGGTDYAQASTTSSGYYNVILVGGDRPLTYNDDPDCLNHPGEACIPCVQDTSDCIEGPQDNSDVKIKISSTGSMPYVDWVEGSSYDVNIVAPLGDWSKEGCVDMTDIGYFANWYLQICTPLIPEECDIYDLYRDYVIDMADVGVFANNYLVGCGG